MTLNIQLGEITAGGLNKALETSFGSSFEMNDQTDVVERRPVRPGLLTTLLGGSVNSVYGYTHTFTYDEVEMGMALPSGKSYSEFGKDVQKERAAKRYFEIPSFGLTARVAPADWANRRQPGTNQLMTEEYLIAQLEAKVQNAYDLMDELGFAQLLTTDTNITLGGPFTSYNFYTDIVGTARPAPTYVDTSAANPEIALRAEVEALQEEISRSNDSMTGVIAIAGTAAFNAMYEVEQNVGLARPIVFGLDLAQQPIQTMSGGGNTTTYQVQYFDSFSGIRFVNYGASILAGQRAIPSDRIYLIPVGARNLIRLAYAPALTRTYSNTQALGMYTWTKTDERLGVVMATESNKLYSLVNPRAIRVLTITDPDA